ncbi:MAG: tetratricopeptide repeat protein [Leptolyngbyaceae cyanobacterium bins.302]|nr:tetratricopeptide repeat protein [Leptolyngbyaceae cyanobacterium bins.302]
MKSNRWSLLTLKFYSLLVPILFFSGVAYASPQPTPASPQPNSVSQPLSESQRREVKTVVEETIKQERETLHDRVQSEVDNNFQWVIAFLTILITLIGVVPIAGGILLWYLRDGLKGELISHLNKELEIELENQKKAFEQKLNDIENELFGKFSFKLEKKSEIGAIFDEFRDRRGFRSSTLLSTQVVSTAQTKNEAKRLSEKLENLISHDPELLKTAEDYIKRGDIAYFAGEYESAINSYAEALKKKPDDYEILYRQGNAMLKLKRYEDAIETYEKALEIKPDNNVIWGRWGDAIHQLGRSTKEAIRKYDAAVLKDPKKYENWYLRGNAWASLGNGKQAIDDYTRAIKLCSKLDITVASIYHSRGNVKAILKQPKEAIQDYEQALRIKPDYSWALNSLGHEEVCLQQYQKAIHHYTQAIELNPDDNFFWIGRGDAWMHLNQYENALQDYNTALRIFPNYQAWYGRGNALTGLKHYQEAILSYDKALEIKADDTWCWHSRGDALRKSHQFELAIESYDRALKLTDNFKSWYKRGKALSRLADYEQAIDNYNKAIKLSEEDRNGLLSNRGYALKKLGRITEAQADFRRVVENCDRVLSEHPNDGEAWYEKARCYMLQNKQEEARKFLDKAILSKPECRRWAEADLEFEELYPSFDQSIETDHNFV